MIGTKTRVPSHRGNRWWLVLIILMTTGGCNTGGILSGPLLTDNGRFMDLWETYVHCQHTEDLHAMRLDAERLNRPVDIVRSTTEPIQPERDEPVRRGSTVRLSADPAAMAAACALRVGQVAQGAGHSFLAQEMFQLVITKFRPPPYRYYVAQARQGLEALHTGTPAFFSPHAM